MSRYDAWTGPTGSQPGDNAGDPAFGKVVLVHLGMAILLSSATGMIGNIAQDNAVVGKILGLMVACVFAAVGFTLSAKHRPALHNMAGTFLMASGSAVLAVGFQSMLFSADDWDQANGNLITITVIGTIYSVIAYALRRSGWTLVSAFFWVCALGLSCVAHSNHDSPEAYGAVLVIAGLALVHLTNARVTRPLAVALTLSIDAIGVGTVVINAAGGGWVGPVLAIFYLAVLNGLSLRKRTPIFILLTAFANPILLAEVLVSANATDGLATGILVGTATSVLLAAEAERRSPVQLRLGVIYVFTYFAMGPSTGYLAQTDHFVSKMLALVGSCCLLAAATSSRRKILTVLTALSLISTILGVFNGGSILGSLLTLAVGAVVAISALKNHDRPTARPAANLLTTVGELPEGKPLEATFEASYDDVYRALVAAVSTHGALDHADRASGRISGQGVVVTCWLPNGSTAVHVAIFGDPQIAETLVSAAGRTLAPQSPVPVG